ncbi:MAG: hypothetical protein AMJ79_12860, partial [Phycisphaerae bacterium SM23_30]
RERIFLPTISKILACNKKTGKEIRDFSYSLIFSDIAWAEDRLIITSTQKMSDIDPDNHYIILRLDIQKGQLQAKYNLPKNSIIPPNLVFDGQNIYCAYESFPLRSLSIHCLNINDSKVLWRAKFDGYAYLSRKPCLHEGRLYIFTCDLVDDVTKKDIEQKVICEDENFLYACDAKTGKILWRIEFETGEGGGRIKPIYFNEQLLFSSGNRIYAISMEEGKIITLRQGEKISQLTIYEKRLFWAEGERIFTLNLDSV